jgi:5-oxopent-3-ene-1,2,5-tricarboxylate decarboxylase/2-hydroxyhepta-2,4-diene-1,7-dioate isomerase
MGETDLRRASYERSHPVSPSREAEAALRRVSTATLTSQLLERGFRNTFLAGLEPQRPDLRLVGYAFTLRYVPAREDLGFHVHYDNERDVQRRAVESIGEGDVLVIDARNETNAASFGQIIATRIQKRGAAGLVTDGALRDRPSFAEIEMPSYCRATHATTSSVKHLAVDMNVPIGCASVLVMPRDIVVGDREGVVVIPAAVAEEVAHGALEQERVELFALERVRAGEPISELYPLSATRREEFERWLSRRP